MERHGPGATGVVRLQPLTRRKVASLGEPGRAWLADLPRVLDELAERWELTWERPLPGGSASYVVRGRTPSGEARVVKVGVPDLDEEQPLEAEAAVLRAAGGRGYALLHDDAPEHRALLLESLGRSLQQAPAEPEVVLDVLVDTLREAWTVPVAAVGTGGSSGPGGEPRARQLARLVATTDDRLGGACRPDVRRQALTCAERLADPGPDGEVVVHGDAHPANALRVPEPRVGAPVPSSGHVLVDPDGFACDPAYDLGVTLREWNARLEAGGRPLLEAWCDRVAERSGCDRDRIWAWAFLERVSTGLYVCGFGAHDLGSRFLRTAELLLDPPPSSRSAGPNPGPTGRP
ncbi:aminoglycoside phosphotransferase family protein [Nocardioides scoriae]|uniref:aminoglycoside phosphotransferase family protein n=1 Tax=Nocardioides scoriae TaxID=642780 RepID=UPI0012F89D78|nr:aminoglycoside phosphotransferase family protein [Nocardioides scoriae]